MLQINITLPFGNVPEYDLDDRTAWLFEIGDIPALGRFDLHDEPEGIYHCLVGQVVWRPHSVPWETYFSLIFLCLVWCFIEK